MTAVAAAGSAVLLASSLFLGYSTLRVKNAVSRNTRSLADLVRFIRSDITYFLTPLDGLFAAFADENLEKEGFSAVLRANGLAAALDSGTLVLSPGTEKIMREFAASIGKGLRDGEINLCDCTVERLTAEEERLREELEKRRDVYRFVPPLGALFLILCLM